MPNAERAAELFATARDRWPTSRPNEVTDGGVWHGAVRVWTFPILPLDDGTYMTPNLGRHGRCTDDLVFHSLENAVSAVREVFADMGGWRQLEENHRVDAEGTYPPPEPGTITL